MIEEIIKKEMIDIHFQPIISIRTKKIIAYEALTRCVYNDEIINPSILFQMARDRNLLFTLDELARSLAIKKFSNYYKNDNDLILFLNFESSLLNNFDIERKHSFIKLIDKLDIPYSNFMLEIKEDEIENTKSLKAFCKTYKKMGFSIALDDFGTGSSTFDRINIVKPTLIKIDKSLFDDIKNNHINKEIVRAIAKMGHNLGIRILAEGVEDEDSICISLKASINLFQGYYFSKAKKSFSIKEIKKIIEKTQDIGDIFKKRTLNSLKNKLNDTNKYNLIVENIINNTYNLNKLKTNMQAEFFKYDEIEAIYLIDANTSKQIFDTFIVKDLNTQFKPTKHGDEHYLKEYYYITLDSKQGTFLSQKYISYASGNTCKTYARRFEINKICFIMCIDIVIK